MQLHAHHTTTPIQRTINDETCYGVKIDIPDGNLVYIPQLFSAPRQWYQLLHTNIAWQQDEIFIYGKRRKIPRMQAWYGSKSYTYSNLTLPKQAWTPLLYDIKHKVEQVVAIKFNSVLLNLYRNGTEYMNWHSDNEPELGSHPIIASVSFGAKRDFMLRHKHNKYQKITLPLESGSILVMGDTIQHYYEHSLPKRLRCNEPRINLTFRIIQDTTY